MEVRGAPGCTPHHVTPSSNAASASLPVPMLLQVPGLLRRVEEACQAHAASCVQSVPTAAVGGRGRGWFAAAEGDRRIGRAPNERLWRSGRAASGESEAWRELRGCARRFAGDQKQAGRQTGSRENATAVKMIASQTKRARRAKTELAKHGTARGTSRTLAQGHLTPSSCIYRPI